MENENVNITEAGVGANVDGVCESGEAVIEPVAESKSTIMLERSDFEMLINGFKAYYDALLRTVKATKEKDATIAKITKELQKHREGYAKGLKKPIAVSIISFREDSEKTLREIENYAKDKESVLKYLDYIIADIQAIMELYDIEETADGFTVKGKPIEDYDELTIPELPDAAQIPDTVMPAYTSELSSLEAALEFMKMGQASVEAAVKNNSVLDSNLDKYVDILSTLDKYNSIMLLMPIYRGIVNLYNRARVTVDCAREALGDDTWSYTDAYRLVLKNVSEYAYELLLFLGVSVIDDISDDFDMKTSKILNVVNTDKPELDKKVCTRYTSCYQLDGTVLYPSKVSVYKFVNT